MSLARVYSIPEPILVFQKSRTSLQSYCCVTGTGRCMLVLTGHSVVTYLHEFAHALGRNERGACRWSLNLFCRVFPREFARCAQRGHCLVRE
jgi:hypothetical protein